MLSRRDFLLYVGMGSYSLMRSVSGASAAAAFPTLRSPGKKATRFSPIAPTREDRLILPPGFEYDVLASYGDPLDAKGSALFGYDNDFLAFFPLNALQGGKDSDHGLLWVNHEYVNPLFLNGVARTVKRSVEMLQREHDAVGGSVIEIQKIQGRWKRVENSRFARRFTADSPAMRMTGPAASRFSQVAGTLANCSGGRTPWHTVLSAEENFHLFNSKEDRGLGWGEVPQMAIQEEHFGWIVEADPFGELPPKKHTALGRFAHENAALRVGKTGRLAIYMGDDCADQYLYKYVSHAKFSATLTRAEQSALLESGTLYAADFSKGQWLSLDVEKNPSLRKAGFQNQADVCLRTRDAAKAVGATPIDRPEDCEVHPLDGSLYLALTNNSKHGNFHGQIVRLVENQDDAEAEKFRFEIYLAGGAQSGLSSPDNLLFDKGGNLWVTCDVSSHSIGKGIYESFGNNGLYQVPTRGANAGKAFQFASGPVEAELTGPWFNEKEDTLFLSVQHPGEETVDLAHPTSRWPTGKGLPKPSVVAVRGF